LFNGINNFQQINSFFGLLKFRWLFRSFHILQKKANSGQSLRAVMESDISKKTPDRILKAVRYFVV